LELGSYFKVEDVIKDMWDEVTIQKVTTKDRQERQQNDCEGTIIRMMKLN
jgi:hypothetical protein